jgi:hypothetical protein
VNSPAAITGAAAEVSVELSGEKAFEATPPARRSASKERTTKGVGSALTKRSVQMHTTLTTTGYMAQNLPLCNVTGRDLDIVRRKSSPTTQALKAADLVLGDLSTSHLLPYQARFMTGASLGYLATALDLTAEQRDQILLGQLTLSEVHRRLPFRTDAWLDRLIRQVGIARMQDALNRTTGSASMLPVYAFANPNFD